MTDLLHPHVVLMDVGLPRLGGVEATRLISQRRTQVRVIGLSMHSEGDLARSMREAGAVDYLTKTGPTEELLAAIRKAGNV